MSEFKGTPGLWQGHDGRIYVEETRARKKIVIATVHHPNAVACYPKMDNSHEPLREERDANTRLIAAAPELLEALKEVTEMYGKAVMWMLDHEDDARKWPDWMPGCRTIIENAEAAIAKAKGE